MKALRLHGRGGPEKLFYEDAPAPILEPGEALVRVHACAITKAELTWSEVHQAPDCTEREFVVPGHEISGTVEAVSPDVDSFAIGEEVYALVDFNRVGGAAEFVTVPVGDLAPKPKTVDHIHAAALPLAGLTAWQALFDHANLSAGQKILIHGAAGGVGSLAVQFARWRGAVVIGTARKAEAKLLYDIGADKVIDYANEEFEELVQNVDLVFDTVGGEALEKSWQIVKPNGVLVTVADPKGRNPIEKANDYGVRGIYFIVKPNRGQMIEIANLVNTGKVQSIIDSIYPLSDGRKAFEQALHGHNCGKIVLQVA